MSKINLSLVIASYNGYNNIKKLLKSIIQFKYLPNEIIIICYEKQFNKYLHSIKPFKTQLSIKLFKSNIKNQIYQRQIGLKKSKMKYIMQIDDDLTFNKDTFKLINFEMNKNHFKTVLSANLKNSHGNSADIRWVNNYKKHLTFRIIILFLNKFKKVYPNSILESGRPIPEFNNSIHYKWLNSSLCFHRSALKDYEFFTNSGKSYYEDVYTSYSFYSKGYNLKKINNAKIFHPITDKMDIGTFIKTLSNQYKIVKRFKKSVIFFILDLILFSFIFLFRKK